MRRREFIRTALVSGAAGSMGRLVYGSGGQPRSVGEQSSSPANTKLGYIRQEIPAFEIPPYRGERYEDTVPDTHDLAERAGLAINQLTRQTDPSMDYEIYWGAVSYRNPPVLWHKAGDFFNVPKWHEALPLMRVMTGSDFNSNADRVWTEAMLKGVGPDGLYYVGTAGRPWIGIDFTSWRGPILLPDGTVNKSKEPPNGQFTCEFVSGRTIGVMTLHYLRDKNPMWKQTIERMVNKWSELAIDKGDYCYYPVGMIVPNSKFDQNLEMPVGIMAAEMGHRLMQGLSQYYAVSGYEPAGLLAKKLCNFVRHQALFFDSRGRFIDKDPNKAQGHFHSHSFALLGLLDYALAAGDREMAEFVKSSYEWVKTDAYGCALTGFFPESVPQNEEAIQRARISAYRACEGCCIADMIAVAVKLSAAGVGDYWDDVDRWARNQFAVAQMTETDWIYRVAKTLPPRPVAYNETAEHVAERTLGAFAGYTTGNDYGIDFGAGPTGANPTGVAACCVGNGTRAIYYVWRRMLNYDDGQLKVNLLLNRASPWADVHSYIPYEGRVDLKVKKFCQSVLVRVPEWIESHSAQVVCTVNGKRHPLAWEGRYVKVGPAKPDNTVTLTFPISQRTERNVRMGGVAYTLVLKGNTVVSIDPPGKFYSIYERKQYRATQVPWRKVERFVSSEEILW